MFHDWFENFSFEEKKKKSHCNKSTIEDRKIKRERREIKIADWINTYLIRVY